MKRDFSELNAFVFDHIADFLPWAWTAPIATPNGQIRRCREKRHLSGAEAKDVGDIYLTRSGAIGEYGGRAKQWVISYLADISGKSVADVIRSIRSNCCLSFLPVHPVFAPKEPKLPPIYLSDVPIIRQRILGSVWAVFGATGAKDNFTNWLVRLFGAERVQQVHGLYRWGQDKAGRIVWWYIDEGGNVADGKAMRYGRDGHRDKSGALGRVEWYYSRLSRQGILPDMSRRPKIGLFGAHLLSSDINLPVFIVEAEKTAVLGQIYHPAGIWLATGGKGNYHPDELVRILEGRKVIAYPDVDAFEDWRKASEGTDIVVEDIRRYSDVPVGEHADIGDLIVAEQLEQINRN